MRVVVADCASEASRRESHSSLAAAATGPVIGAPGMNADLDAIADRPAPVNSDATIAATLHSAAALPAGAELISSLAAVDVTRLNPADRIRYLTAMQRAHNWLTGVFHVAVAAAAGPPPAAAHRPSPDPRSPTGDMEADIVCADTDSGIAATAAANVTGRLRSAPRCTPTVLRKRLQRAISDLAPEQTITRIKAKRRDRSAELHNGNDLRGRLEVDAPWPALNWTFGELSVWAEQRLANLRELRRAYPEVPLCCTEAVNAAIELFALDHWADDTPANTQTTPGGKPDAAGGEAYGNRYDHTGETNVDGADAGVALGACQWCGATDDRLPTLSQLRADALFAAVRLLSASRSADGGDSAETAAWNLHPLCRTHHRLKTHGGWRVTTTTTGWHTWTSPLGLKYTHRVVPPWLDP